jgi:hypothetical protein
VSRPTPRCSRAPEPRGRGRRKGPRLQIIKPRWPHGYPPSFLVIPVSPSRPRALESISAYPAVLSLTHIYQGRALIRQTGCPKRLLGSTADADRRVILYDHRHTRRVRNKARSDVLRPGLKRRRMGRNYNWNARKHSLG